MSYNRKNSDYTLVKKTNKQKKPTRINDLVFFVLITKGRSGSDRLQLVWSSLLKQETTLLFRECSRRHTFTPRVWCPVWTREQDCICTEEPLRHLRLSRGSSYPESCCRVELRHNCPRICPRTCPRCLPPYPDPHRSGEHIRSDKSESWFTSGQQQDA